MLNQNPPPVQIDFTNGYPATVYDEQLLSYFKGFTTQNYQSLSYTVTVTQQSGKSGYGPAYLLNAYTDSGAWYQVGLDYNWPVTGPGFYMVYEVFGSPTNPGPVERVDFSGPINLGDNVVLTLDFNNGTILVSAKDLNTGAIAQALPGTVNTMGTKFDTSEICDATSKACIFTGLMTEERHINPYYGNEQQVTYNVYGSTPTASSATDIIGEFNTVTKISVFPSCSENFNYSSNPSRLNYLAYEDAVITSEASEVITGGSLPPPPYYTCT